MYELHGSCQVESRGELTRCRELGSLEISNPAVELDVCELIEVLELDPLLLDEGRRALLGDVMFHLPERLAAVSDEV